MVETRLREKTSRAPDGEGKDARRGSLKKARVCSILSRIRYVCMKKTKHLAESYTSKIQWSNAQAHPFITTVSYLNPLSLQRGGDPAGAVVHHRVGRGHVPRGDGHARQGEDHHAQRGARTDRVHLLGQDRHPHPGTV